MVRAIVSFSTPLELRVADYESQIRAAAAELTDYTKQITAAEARLAAIKAEIESLNAAKAFASRTQQLAKLYAAMKPDSAAAILCKLEKDLTMRILSQMDNRTSGKLMEAVASIDPDYAASISKLIADSDVPGGRPDQSGEPVTRN